MSSNVQNDQQNNWQQVYQEDQQRAHQKAVQAENASAAERAAGAAPGAGVTPGKPAVPGDAVNNTQHASAPNGGVINNGAPVLPGTVGEAAPPRQVATVVNNNSIPLNTNGLAWAAMEAMTDSAQQEFSQQSKIKRDAEGQKISEKAQEISDTKTQIAGQRQQSVDLLAGSVVAAGASFGMGVAGAKLAFGTNGSNMALGQGLVASGQASGQLINNLAQATDKLAGGGRQADDAGVAIKIDQKNQDMAQQIADSANSLLQNAQQEWQKAQQMITDMNDRRMQASNQVANQ